MGAFECAVFDETFYGDAVDAEEGGGFFDGDEAVG